MNTTKYSVIVPHKNNFNGLQRLVKSIPEDEKIQIVLIDDNSEENIQKKLLKTYSSSQFINIIFNNGEGAGSARNLGIRYSCGKWLLFADSDDLFINNFEKVLDEYCVEKNDLIYFPPITNNIEKDDYRTRYQELFYEYHLTPTIEKKWNIRLNVDAPWSKAIKRSFIEKNNLQFDNTKKQNDTIFGQKVGIISKNVVIASQPIYMVVDRKDSITHQSSFEIFNDVIKVRIRSYLLKNQYFNKKQLKKFDSYVFQLPFLTLVDSFRLFRNFNYTFFVYKELKKKKIPVFTFFTFLYVVKRCCKSIGEDKN